MLAAEAEFGSSFLQYGTPGALVLVMLIFIGFIKYLVDKFMESHKTTMASVEKISTECHQFQTQQIEKYDEISERMHEKLSENSVVQGRTNDTLNRTNQALERLERLGNKGTG